MAENLSNFRRNRLGGIDADRLLNGETVPYTLTTEEVAEVEAGEETIAPFDQAGYNAAVAASDYKAQERINKLSAYTFNNVQCSVTESDQNGWEVLNSRVNELIANGESFRTFPFFMENGNHVLITSLQEWQSFREAGWAAREAIMMARLQQ